MEGGGVWVGAPAWVGGSKVCDPPSCNYGLGGWVCAPGSPPPLTLVWVPLCFGVPFLQTSFFGFVLLCNLARTAVGVEYSFQMWTRVNVK